MRCTTICVRNSRREAPRPCCKRRRGREVLAWLRQWAGDAALAAAAQTSAGPLDDTSGAGAPGRRRGRITAPAGPLFRRGLVC
jgi:hypothetical protein